MFRIFCLSLIVFMVACATQESAVSHEVVEVTDDSAVAVELGKLDSNKTWIYLSGLTTNFDDVQEKANRDMLEKMALERGIKIVAVKPTQRCPQFDNKLCWHTKGYAERRKMLDYIHDVAGTTSPAGYLGFSNGAALLIDFAAMDTLSGPVIAVGAAGHYSEAPYRNNLHLLIGQNDFHYYKAATDYFERMKSEGLNVVLHEHIGGHEFPVQQVADIIEILALAE